MEAYKAAGVDEICVVRGYQKERIAFAELRYFENPEYRSNNILASLFYAEEAMGEGFLFSYSDIVFRPEVVRQLVAREADYGLIVDRRFEDVYVGRDQHPIEEAELAHVVDGRVLAVGKRVVPREQARGEFIGLARFSAKAAALMAREYRRLEAELGAERPFGRAARFGSAYLTDLLNHLIGLGEVMTSVEIEGGWREIDTTQDLERARQIVDW